MSDAPHWDCYVLISHPSEPRLLLFDDGAGLSAPRFEIRERRHPSVVDHLNHLAWDQLGLRLTVLRCLQSHDTHEREHGTRVYVLENHDPQWTPPQNGRWIDRAVFGHRPFTPRELRPLLDAWFEEAEGGAIPPQRVPWASPPIFAHEPQITRGLGARYPGRIPTVLAIDAARSWMVMRAFIDAHLAGIADLAVWEQVLRTYAQIQLDVAVGPA